MVSVQAGQIIDVMYIGFSSDTMQPNQITDYLVRAVQPKLQYVKGVRAAEVLGARTSRCGPGSDPGKLAAYNLTAAKVSGALVANDYISGLGMTKGQMVQRLDQSASRRGVPQSGADVDGAVVRLQDVANVFLGSDNYIRRSRPFNGKPAVLIVEAAPHRGACWTPSPRRAQGLSRHRRAGSGRPERRPSSTNSAKYVESSIREVMRFEAVVIVTLVVFLFLRVAAFERHPHRDASRCRSWPPSP